MTKCDCNEKVNEMLKERGVALTQKMFVNFVECDDKTYWPVFERHEIEVIDQ